METIIHIPEDKPEGSASQKCKKRTSRSKTKNEEETKTKKKDKTKNDEEETKIKRKDKTKKKDKKGHRKCCGSSNSYNPFSMCSGNGKHKEIVPLKKAVPLALIGIVGGVGAALLFLKFGGSFAGAAGGLASVAVASQDSSKIDGDRNTVVNSGSKSLININSVAGGSEDGIDAAHKLTWAGMTDRLKRECLRRGMIYIDPTTSSWWAYSSMSESGRCMLDLPEEMLKGECFDASERKKLIDLENKKQKALQAQGIVDKYYLASAAQKRLFLEKKLKEDILLKALADKIRSRGRVKRDTEPQEEKQDSAGSKKATLKFLNDIRGEDVNKKDMRAGLNWLKRGAKR